MYEIMMSNSLEIGIAFYYAILYVAMSILDEGDACQCYSLEDS